MTYEVYLTSEAETFLKKCDKSVRDRIVKMKNESFTDVINRLANKTSILELKGLLSRIEADSILNTRTINRSLSRSSITL